MLQQILAIFLVLGLLLAGLWLLRRQGLATFNLAARFEAFGRKRGSHKHMRVIERVALTSQHSLHLVSIEERLLVFSVSPNGCHAVDPCMPAATRQPSEAVPFRNGAAC
jgi:flagellar biogenesis protein FliO